jgi:hypothetical protein
LEGGAEGCDLAGVKRAGAFDELMAEAEVAVALAPLDLSGEAIEHTELLFRHATIKDDLSCSLNGAAGFGLEIAVVDERVLDVGSLFDELIDQRAAIRLIGF